MKVVLLAGGFGTRISEESQFKPKPMIEIGGKPILWHIMKEYAYYGFDEFIICAGYKQYVIKEWFADYFLHNSDITFALRHLSTASSSLPAVVCAMYHIGYTSILKSILYFINDIML